MRHRANLLDKIEKYSALTVLRLPHWLLGFLAGRQIEIDGYKLDPVVQFMVKYFVKKTTIKSLQINNIRRSFDVQGSWLSQRPDPNINIEKWYCSARDNYKIKCEIYRHTNLKNNAPLLIYYHGGGYAAGSLTSHRNVCLALAAELDCLVIAPEYRLAPEHKFPEPIEDCLDAYDAITENCASFGINEKRIAVAGDSAGANAAAVIAQQKRKAIIAPKLQVLWVPWVDLSRESKSYASMHSGFFLDRATLRWYIAQYLHQADDALNPLASPLLSTDVSNLCPAIIFVAGFDPLREEGIAYADKLKNAGNSVKLCCIEGAVHPMVNIAGKIPIAQSSFAQAVKLIKQQL